MLVNSIKVTENIQHNFLNYQYYVHPRLIYFQLLEVSHLTLSTLLWETKVQNRGNSPYHVKDAAVVKKVLKRFKG